MKKILSLFIALNMMNAVGEDLIMETAKDTTAPVIEKVELVNASQYSDGSSHVAEYNFSLNEKARSYTFFVEKDYYETNKLSIEEIINISTASAGWFGGFATDDYCGVYNSGYYFGSSDAVRSVWFKPDTEYIFIVIAVDEAGNISEPSVIEFVTNPVTTGVFEIEASYLGRNFETNQVECVVSSDKFVVGVTFNYVAIPKNANAKAPTYAQVVEGLDGYGNIVDIKGSVLTDLLNYKFFGFEADDIAYDVYIVGTHGEAKSDVIKTVVTLDRDVTKPEITWLGEILHSDMYSQLQYGYSVNETGKAYIVVLPKSDANKYATSLHKPIDIKNLALGNTTLGESVEYFSNVDYLYEENKTAVWLPDGLPDSKNNEYVFLFTVEDSSGNLSNDVLSRAFGVR